MQYDTTFKLKGPYVNKFENKLKNTDNLFYKKIVVIYLLILFIVMLSCHVAYYCLLMFYSNCVYVCLVSFQIYMYIYFLKNDKF